jgi:putative CocE/NonD family hydrolase
MMVRHVKLIASLIGLAVVVPGWHASPSPGVETTTTYDVYVVGVRGGELTVQARAGVTNYALERKDFAANQWSEAVALPEDKVATDARFALWGAIRSLPAQMKELRRIHWLSLEAVGWPDPNTIYVRHRQLEKVVDGQTVSATYWARRDATQPMDLIFGADNELIAGIDVSADIVMVRRGYEDFTTVGRWNDPTVSQAKYGYRKHGKFMVPMDDGVRLATLVYLPDGDVRGPFSTVFVRTPYGITNSISRYWHYAARGFAVVLQAARGTSYWDPENCSEGEWDLMINEPRDGATALEWITRQPWSNGKIGMQGASYYGYTQWAATMAGNPALKCIIPEVSMGTAFSDQPFMGGGFVGGVAYYMFWMLDKPILPNRTWTEILHYRPLIDIDEYATGQDIPQWNTLLEHWTNDDYWKKQDWYNSNTQRDIASFQISGWFDDDFPGTQSNWQLMQRTSDHPQHLILGPWKHGYNVDRKLNGFSFGVDALRNDIWLRKQQWYDRFLKGIDNGISDNIVQYFVLGTNQWRRASTWPPETVDYQNWYFHSDGNAHRLTTRGTLDKKAPAQQEPPDVYIYDPQHAAPNWANFDRMERWQDIQRFPYDFKDIESRPDVVTFTSPVLEDDVTIAGDIRIVLYASTDVRDTDWWIHLSDVQPDGASVRLTTGMLRARFRCLEDPRHQIFGSNFTKEQLLSGDFDDVVRYEIAIPSVANTFQKGHRIRIALMNALDNYGFPNSNTGEHEAYVTRTVVGTMAIHHSPGQASHVVLPVLPH